MSASGKPLQAEIQETKEAPRLPQTRPIWVDTAIETEYSVARKSPFSYYFIGNENYEFRCHGCLLETKDAVPAYQQKHQKEIDIGDIGSGGNQLANALNKKAGIRALGVSAADHRRPEQRGTKDPTYLFANAEKVSEIREFQGRDIIFSRYTFIHFADQAGSLCSAYRALKPGGILIIDTTALYPKVDYHARSINAFKGWHKELVAYLQSEGHEVAAIQGTTGNSQPASYTEDCYELFAIVKTKDELSLPLKYKSTRAFHSELQYDYDGGVSYQPNDDLIRFREKRRSEEKEEEMKAIDADLQTLLAKPDYLRLSPLEQARAIKNIVKRMSSRQREDNLNRLDEHKEAAESYYQINLKQTPHKLAICDQSSWSLEPEVALMQVKALAALELTIEEEKRDFDLFLGKYLGIQLKDSPVQNGRWRVASILPSPFIPAAKEMELFKFIFNTEIKAESGIFKSSFLKGKEDLNPLELKREVETYSRQRPNGRTAQVWRLTQRFVVRQPTIAELNTAIEGLALSQSGISIFHKLSPHARQQSIRSDCNARGIRFCRS